MFLYILALIALSIAVFFFYMGFHRPIVIEKTRLGRRYVLYTQHSLDYKNTGKLFKELKADIKNDFGRSLKFGVFYDDPNMIVDRTKCRASVGIYVEPSEIAKAQEFAAAHKNYHFKELPETDAVRSTFPYKNLLSVFWVVKKVFPAMMNYLVQQKLVEDLEEEMYGIFENYHWTAPSKYTEIIIPYGKRVQQDKLTTIPSPTLKPEFRSREAKKSD